MKLHEDRFQWRPARELKAGQVYVLPRNDGYWICMAANGAKLDTKFAVVLGESDGASGDLIPRFVNLDALDADMVARCTSAAIEPGPGDPPLGVAIPSDSALPGYLALDGEGRAYVYVRQNGRARFFDITGGKTLDFLNCRAAFKSWRVLALHATEQPLVLAEHKSA